MYTGCGMGMGCMVLWGMCDGDGSGGSGMGSGGVLWYGVVMG